MSRYRDIGPRFCRRSLTLAGLNVRAPGDVGEQFPTFKQRLVCKPCTAEVGGPQAVAARGYLKPSAAWAAARRAMGTRNGEQDT